MLRFTSDTERRRPDNTCALSRLAFYARGDWCLTRYFDGSSRLRWLNKDHLLFTTEVASDGPESGSLALQQGIAYGAADHRPIWADHKSVTRIANIKESKQ